MATEREDRIREYLKTLEVSQNSGVTVHSSSLQGCPNDSILVGNFSDIMTDNPLSNPTSIVAVVLGSLAIIANLASLCAMSNIRPRLSSNQRMIVSLILSDLVLSSAIIAKLVSAHVHPYALSNCDNYVSSLCIEMVTRSIFISGHLICLFNLVCLAFDHFIAINKPLQYPRVLTRKNVAVLLTIMWLAAFILGFSKVWMPASTYSFCDKNPEGFCLSVYCSSYEPEYLLFALVFVTFTSMGFFYTNIYITISKYQSISIRQERNARRNIKGLVTTIIILITFLVCWLPYCLFEMVLIINLLVDHTSLVSNLQYNIDATYYLHYLVLLNGICDPIIYALRMRDVRRGYYQMVQCKPEELAGVNWNATVRGTSVRDSDQIRPADIHLVKSFRRISEPRRTTESRLSLDIRENQNRSPIPDQQIFL